MGFLLHSSLSSANASNKPRRGRPCSVCASLAQVHQKRTKLYRYKFHFVSVFVFVCVFCLLLLSGFFLSFSLIFFLYYLHFLLTVRVLSICHIVLFNSLCFNLFFSSSSFPLFSFRSIDGVCVFAVVVSIFPTLFISFSEWFYNHLRECIEHNAILFVRN